MCRSVLRAEGNLAAFSQELCRPYLLLFWWPLIQGVAPAYFYLAGQSDWTPVFNLGRGDTAVTPSVYMGEAKGQEQVLGLQWGSNFPLHHPVALRYRLLNIGPELGSQLWAILLPWVPPVNILEHADCFEYKN